MMIRQMTDGDIGAVCALIERNLREVNAREYPAQFIEEAVEAHNRDWIAAQAQEGRMVVAVCDGGMVHGCAALRQTGAAAGGCLLHTVFVTPGMHRQGIGSRLVHALEDDARSMRAVRVEVPSLLTAVGFFQKLGYAYQNGLKRLGKDGYIRMEKPL